MYMSKGRDNVNELHVMAMGAQGIATTRVFSSEEDLARALAASDQRAWRQLFEEQYDRVFRYAYMRTGNVADADDIASTVFSEAVKGIASFSYRGTPVAAWLYGIAHNETVDLLKRRRRNVADSIDAASTAHEIPGRDAFAPADEWRDVRDAMAALKPQYRDVLVLRLVEGLSVAEVAAALNKSEGAVKVTQMRALEALRGRLDR
jgi:RNA polymerase sigma-70 factor (ECF subfamily)